jgi:glycine cleavage system H protein
MYFTPSHEWIHCESNIGSIGITLFAQKELGEVVFVELPKIGRKVQKGQEIAVLESTKAAADIYSPVSGEVVEVNNLLLSSCDKINTSPEREGWICKIKLEDVHELEDLLDSEGYTQLIKGS